MPACALLLLLRPFSDPAPFSGHAAHTHTAYSKWLPSIRTAPTVLTADQWHVHRSDRVCRRISRVPKLTLVCNISLSLSLSPSLAIHNINCLAPQLSTTPTRSLLLLSLAALVSPAHVHHELACLKRQLCSVCLGSLELAEGGLLVGSSLL